MLCSVEKCWAVALRKESVDRNKIGIATIDSIIESLSARRAWIEMLYQLYDTYAKVVALRKESVDRNYRRFGAIHDTQMSLSARRAWIEICSVCSSKIIASCRSPQGERG